MRKALIYAWLCPTTGIVVYVGKTSTTIERRMTSHFGKAKRHPKTPKERWLAGILTQGLRPSIEILETTTVENSSIAEKRWASKFRPDGHLLNHDRVGGGNPGVGRVEWTSETLSLLGKIGDARLARMLGCERKTVSYRRECLGIPAAFDRTDNTPPPPMGGWNEIELPEDIIGLLGSEPDHVLGKRAGVSKDTIARVRMQRGIPDYAASTGNDGKIKAGDPHPRWGSRRAQQAKALEARPTDHVTNAIWLEVQHLFPRRPKPGRRDIPDRAVLTTILRAMESGLKWLDIAEGHAGCSGTTAYGRLRSMVERGQWDKIEKKLRATLPDPDRFDWSRAQRNYYRKSAPLTPPLREASLFDDF